MDYTGTGNTLNMRNPYVLQLVMDSLRYWATEMHVDGFRFDLASALARSLHEVDRLSAFFDLVQQDPVISRMKLIAEPWDVGEGGYQVGNFPPQWAEWNGRYRDCIRDHWAGAPHTASASSPTASPARATCTRRPAASPHASINFVTAHDGFTLRDLVTLQREAQRGQRRGQQRRREPQPRLELRRRGPDRRSRDQRAARPPAAQPAGHAAAVAGRADAPRRRRDRPHAAAATTTPTARTTRSRGSTGSTPTTSCCAFTSALIAFRRDHPTFRRRQFFQGRALHGDGDRRPVPGSTPTATR